MTLGILSYDWLLYWYFSEYPHSASEECLMLSPSWCQVLNTDPYTLLLGIWVSLQLTWVSMLLFVQFIQVARAMTTYENMYGIQDGSATHVTSGFTSTGAPLNPSLGGNGNAPESAADDPLGAAHRHRGFWKQWGRLLGVDTFIETASGRGAATAKKMRKKRNPYSRGYMQNCRDFWCDPAPVFGRRDTGDAVLGGGKINYTEVYESPASMQLGQGGRRRGGYEAVAGNEV